MSWVDNGATGRTLLCLINSTILLDGLVLITLFGELLGLVLIILFGELLGYYFLD